MYPVPSDRRVTTTVSATANRTSTALNVINARSSTTTTQPVRSATATLEVLLQVLLVRKQVMIILLYVPLLNKTLLTVNSSISVQVAVPCLLVNYVSVRTGYKGAFVTTVSLCSGTCKSTIHLGVKVSNTNSK